MASTMPGNCCMRLPLGLTSPMDSASNTVVIPDAMTCASWLSTAEVDGQSTPGRGVMCFSRLSVCNSTSPGSRQSPPKSWAWGNWLRPSAMSTILPSRSTTEPRNTRSAVTTWALLRICSAGMGVFLCGNGRGGYVEMAVGNRFTGGAVVENADQCGAASLGFVHQFQHHLAIVVVKRRGGFVQQHHRSVYHEA